MSLREAAQQALEALKMIDNAMPFPLAKHAIKQLSAALAEPERKPLTDEEIELLAVKHAPPIDPAFAQHDDFIEFARAVERTHGIGSEA
jgi:hypothetical protein